MSESNGSLGLALNVIAEGSQWTKSEDDEDSYKSESKGRFDLGLKLSLDLLSINVVFGSRIVIIVTSMRKV